MQAARVVSVDYVLQAAADRQIEAGLLDSFLDLFDGHDVTATWWEYGRRPGFYPSRTLSRRLAFESHLLGAVITGCYPFRGVKLRCGCQSRQHTCDGRGCSYVVLDLDAHKGESDTFKRANKVMAVARGLGLTPISFVSRSGKGAHLYFFLDRPVTTAVAYDAGRHIAALAGLLERVDVIPSANHFTGLGTLHALPMSPLFKGGGLLDQNFDPVKPEDVVKTLSQAHQRRNDSTVFESLARGEPECSTRRRRRRKRRRLTSVKPELVGNDSKILAGMRISHPQFKSVVNVKPEDWRGRRSSRDSYLVGYMRRQGMSPAGIAAAMRELPGTKASERGSGYVLALIAAQAEDDHEGRITLAGQPLRPAAAKKQRATTPGSPWDARTAPPRSYGSFSNPWWRPDTQERLSGLRGGRSRPGVDGIVLAYLVDRYFRGPVPRRLYFCGRRCMAKALRFPPTTVGAAARRVVSEFTDIVRVVDGVPHPTLRLANAYYVPEPSHHDSVDWYVPPVDSGR